MFDFDQFNEADVREEVIAPLLRKLGYMSGTDNEIIREQELRYPNFSLGRKKPAKDPPLRGKADYILKVQKRICWTIEAKAPNPPISLDDIAQAWTYANHTEVRAAYFVMCNGRTLTIHRAHETEDSPPVLSLTSEELDSRIDHLINILSPQAILRDFPTVEPDFNPPLAPGLRSVARVTSGTVQIQRSSLNSPMLLELTFAIRSGSFERLEDGRLSAYLRTQSPFRSIQEFSDRVGLSNFELVSPDTQLSCDPERPTDLIYEKTVVLPQGEALPNMITWHLDILPQNITCDVLVTAKGHFANGMFGGDYSANLNYPDLNLQVALTGYFAIHLN